MFDAILHGKGSILASIQHNNIPSEYRWRIGFIHCTWSWHVRPVRSIISSWWFGSRVQVWMMNRLFTKRFVFQKCDSILWHIWKRSVLPKCWNPHHPRLRSSLIFPSFSTEYYRNLYPATCIEGGTESVLYYVSKNGIPWRAWIVSD